MKELFDKFTNEKSCIIDTRELDKELLESALAIGDVELTSGPQKGSYHSYVRLTLQGRVEKLDGQ